MGFFHDLPEDIEERLKQARQRAKDEFARKVEIAARAGRQSIGFGMDIDIRSSLERESALAPHQKQAALEYVGEIMFFLIKECSSAALSSEEQLRHVDVWLSLSRGDLLLGKWPVSLGEKLMGRPVDEQEVDRALISWLEHQDEWQKYEALILPTIGNSEVAHPFHHERPTPLLYVEHWGLEPLPVKVRQRINAGLLEIHGQVLDRKLKGEAESWRAAYDLVAECFSSARILSEQVLNAHIPGLVADASSAGGWAMKPFSRTEPTAIYSVRWGSLFYPLWRVASMQEALKGRISYWTGQQLLQEEPVEEEPATSVLPNPLVTLQPAVAATSLGVGDTSLHGMICGDKDPLEWRDIEIVFLSETKVQVFERGEPLEPENYAIMRFEDRRNHNPTLAWGQLRELAEAQGTLRHAYRINQEHKGSPRANPEEVQRQVASSRKHGGDEIAKRIQEIRRIFQQRWKIAEDPIPFVEGTGYVAQFKIRCSPSYNR